LFFSPNTYWRRLAGFTIAVAGLAVIFLLACLVHKHVVVFTSPHRNTHIELPDNPNISVADITLTTTDGLEIAFRSADCFSGGATGRGRYCSGELCPQSGNPFTASRDDYSWHSG
jgi:hypothetical protein